jgi:sortase (surface protein transpeptidase)
MGDPDRQQGEDSTDRWTRLPDVPPSGSVATRTGAHRADESADTADTSDTAVAAPPPREPVGRRVARGMGELLITAGLILLLFVVYEVYVTDYLTGRTQDELTQELREQWEQPQAEGPQLRQVELGDAFGVLRIPRLGEDYARVILEGTSETELSKGPGHYKGTAMPGEPGNVALAGHRVGKGSPFLELDALLPGDPIVVETADSWFVYRVLGDPATGDLAADPSGIPGRQIVRPTDIDVIAPTPNQAASAPSGSYLTLTTCHPRFSAQQRMIIHARLEGGALSKSELPDGPPALFEG